nr:MAG TPA: SERINE/THREONINE PROTEIN PHOSPHATASE [Caudoviricetes sp.]
MIAIMLNVKCCGAGADLRLAVISDSHGRLIAPPNSSFPQ